MTTFIISGLIMFFASWVQGLSGFGSALFAMPLLSMVIDIKIAVPLCTLASLVMATYMAFQLRKHFDRKKLIPLCVGSIPGIILGATLLKAVPSDIIRTLLGILLIKYAAYNLFFTVRTQNIHNRWGYFAGFLSGSIGAAFSTGGPPTIIYTTLKNWTGNEIKATLTGFFFVNGCMVAAAHLINGLTTLTVGKHFLFTVPFILLGTALGSYCYKFFNREFYLKLIFMALSVMGILMIL